VVSPAVRTLRSLPIAGAPFATFASKAIPLTLETLAKHPLRVLKYPALIGLVGKLAGPQIGQTPEETQAQRTLGELSAPRFALLPFRDKDGRALYLDLGYILPFGDLLELADSIQGETGRRANISFLPFGGPAWAIPEVMLNRSTFTGRDITGPADTTLERLQKRINYLAQQWGPALTPPIPHVTTQGGFAYEDIRRSLAGETDWLGRTRSPAAALLANVAGLRAKGVTLPELADFRARQIEKQLDALEAEAMRIASTLRNDPARRDQEIAPLLAKMRSVAEEGRKLLSVIPRPAPQTSSRLPAPVAAVINGGADRPDLFSEGTPSNVPEIIRRAAAGTRR
jgi:hypothetical protein